MLTPFSQKRAPPLASNVRATSFTSCCISMCILYRLIISPYTSIILRWSPPVWCLFKKKKTDVPGTFIGAALQLFYLPPPGGWSINSSPIFFWEKELIFLVISSDIMFTSPCFYMEKHRFLTHPQAFPRHALKLCGSQLFFGLSIHYFFHVLSVSLGGFGVAGINPMGESKVSKSMKIDLITGNHWSDQSS